jgi:hypothetical protein
MNFASVDRVFCNATGSDSLSEPVFVFSDASKTLDHLWKLYPDKMAILYFLHKTNLDKVSFDFFVFSFILTKVRMQLIDENPRSKIFGIPPKSNSLQCCMMINQLSREEVEREVKEILNGMLQDPSEASLKKLDSALSRAVACEVQKDRQLFSQTEQPQPQTELSTSSHGGIPSYD